MTDRGKPISASASEEHLRVGHMYYAAGAFPAEDVGNRYDKHEWVIHRELGRVKHARIIDEVYTRDDSKPASDKNTVVGFSAWVEFEDGRIEYHLWSIDAEIIMFVTILREAFDDVEDITLF